MSELVRVSCSGLACVMIDDLSVGVISRSRRAQGKWFLTSIGGKHKYQEAAVSLFKEWDAEPVEPGKYELVLKMPKEKVARFRDWYVSGRDREVVPLREIREELVDEEKVFASQEVDFCLDSGFILSKVTPRVGLDKGEETQYFFDVYRLHTPGREDAFRQAASRVEGNIRLITRAEALAEMLSRPGLQEDKGKVGDMFKFFGLEQGDLDALVRGQPKEMDVRVYRTRDHAYAGNRLD